MNFLCQEILQVRRGTAEPPELPGKPNLRCQPQVGFQKWSMMTISMTYCHRSLSIAYLWKATFQDLQLANCCELCRRSWRPFAGSCLLWQVLIWSSSLCLLRWAFIWSSSSLCLLWQVFHRISNARDSLPLINNLLYMPKYFRAPPKAIARPRDPAFNSINVDNNDYEDRFQVS